MLPTPTHTFSLPRCTLPYWRLGQGPDLVFVHGWPVHSATWWPIAQRLADRFTCHLFDLPGAGLSQWEPGGDWGVRGLGRLVNQVMDQLELSGPVVLVGHDSGGTFARMAAAERPERVAGLVLGNTEIPGYHPPRLTVLLALARVGLLRNLGRRMMDRPWAQRLMFRDCVVDPALIPGLAARYAAPLRHDDRAWAGAMLLPGQIRARDFDLLAEAHPKITAPVRLVWGQRDPWFPLRACRGMVDTFGGPVELVEVPDARLFAHEEHPEVFVEQIASLGGR